ncbi:MAG TPA: HD domain-containing protein [Bacteroidota bacterium]|nr:HD domain-containing protein [Candidatus Kapabacteria bacterium]HRS00931.1 HD domain-containing protein [Bacteroidota bacterium]
MEGLSNLLLNSEDKDVIIDDLLNELSKLFLANVEILAKLTQLTEKYYDGSHSRFVAEKSVTIAKQLDITDENLTEIRIAALLHDIGKIGFSDSLLFKNTQEMDPNEYKNYTLHPEVAYNILSANEHFQVIRKIIYQHHERLDGSGFPLHLTEEKIHRGAKIIAVVDVYHNSIYKRKSLASHTNNTIQNATTSSFLEATKDQFNSIMNYLYKKRKILFDAKIVDTLIEIETFERKQLGSRTVLRLPVNRLTPGQIIADDYYNSLGILIAGRGDILTEDSIRVLIRLAENDEIPQKILVIE